MKLSVVVTTYQRPDGRTPYYLHRTLSCIDRQNFRDYKVFLIGDAYTNNLEFKRIARAHKNIIAHNNPVSPERERYGHGNMQLWCAAGVTAANTGIEMALNDGYEYICHLAHDDIWEPNHLEVINSMVEAKKPIFCCTLSTYFKQNIMPGPFEVTGEVLPYYPIDGGMIASSACVKYSDTKLRVVDRLHTEGIMSPADAYLWECLRNEMKATGKEGYVATIITCHHDEEGYAIRAREKPILKYRR